MNALAIFTYPGVESYLKPLVSSVNEQTSKNFTVFFVNDGLSELDEYINNLSVSAEVFQVSGSPYKNRIDGLKKLHQLHVENLIFQDADDLMAPNRVEECLKYLDSNSLVVNDLDLISHEGNVIDKKYWSGRLEHEFAFNYQFITHYNLLGFTNTSIKGDLLEYLPGFQKKEIIAADWFIFYGLLRQSGANARFINSTTSMYRQHTQNVTGLGGLNESRLKKALIVKRKHYQALADMGYNVEDELSRISQLEKVTQYKFKKKINPHLFWWEETEYIYEES